MANDLLERPDQKDDEELNPGQKHADDLFDFLENPDNVADSSQEDDNIDRKKIRDSEVAGSLGSGVATPRRKAANKDELRDREEPENLYNPDGDGKRRMRGWFNTRRRKQAGIAGTIATVITGGGIVATIITTGPLQLIHLGQTLEHSFSKMEGDSANRDTSLIEFARALRTGDYRYTKVSVLGARTVDKVLGDLKAVGVTFEGSNFLGRPTSVAIERDAFEKSFPETKGMSEAELKSFAASKFSADGTAVSPEDFKPVSIRGKPSLKLDIRRFKLGAIKSLVVNGQIGLLGTGKLQAGWKARAVGKFMGLGSLFHPFSRAVQSAINSKLNKLGPGESEEDTDKKTIQEGTAEETSGVDAHGKTASDKIAEEVDKQQKGDKFKKYASAGLAFVVEAACVLHDVGDQIATYQYYTQQAPAEVHAAKALADQSQLENGMGGISADQVNGTAASYINKAGQTVFPAAAMQALQGNPPAKDSKGRYVNDLPRENRQAFDEHSTAHEFKAVADKFLSIVVSPAVALSGGLLPTGTAISALCNPYAQIIALAGFGLLSFASDFFDDGGTTAAEMGAAAALTAGDVADQVVLQKYVLGPAAGWVLNWFIKGHTAGKLAADAFSGPLGGNLLAFGGRAAANVAAIGAGGIAIAGSTHSTLVSPQDKVAMAQFQHESMFARMFNAKDYRSLTGRLADSVSPSLFINASSMLSGLLNTGGSFLHGFGALIPRASAASGDSWSGDFQWGFPQYGIPDSMLNDPDLANPYQNSTNVGSFFENSCVERDDKGNVIARGPQYGVCSGDAGYTQRIKACFENRLSYQAGSDSSQDVWDVTPIAGTQADPVEVNPNDSPYTDPGMDCNKVSDQTWKRIVMYVNDTHNIKDMACFTGDDQSCDDEGINNGNGSDNSGGTTGNGKVEFGTDAQLAKKLLDYKKTGQYNCDNAGDCADLQKMVNGQSLAGSQSCSAKQLDPRVLQLLLYLIENGGFKIGTYAMCGDHGPDSPRGHNGGFAVDISSVNGTAVNQDTAQTKANVLRLDLFLDNNMPPELDIYQQINYGYGNHYDADLAATQQYNGELCKSSCVADYGAGTEAQHENHVHVGF